MLLFVELKGVMCSAMWGSALGKRDIPMEIRNFNCKRIEY